MQVTLKTQTNKSFLLLFFKKEDPFFLALGQPAA